MCYPWFISYKNKCTLVTTYLKGQNRQAHAMEIKKNKVNLTKSVLLSQPRDTFIQERVG